MSEYLKITPLFLTMFVSFAAVSCVKEEGKVAEDKPKITISAFVEESSDNVGTKVGLGENNSVVWKEGDQITVIGSGSNRSDFDLSDGVGNTRGTFSGSLPTNDDGKPYYAVLPTNGDTGRGEEYITFTIPQDFKGQENDIDNSACPMVGTYVNGNPVQFKNVFGLLKMTFKSATTIKIKKITLHDLGGNLLWGTCTVPIETDGSLKYAGATLSNSNAGGNTINMVWDTPVEINSTGVSCYFPVPNGSLDRGFSMVLYKADDNDDLDGAYTFIQKISSPYAAQRSKIVAINTVTLTEKSEPKDVKARGYYKTLFIDGAKGLNHLVNSSDLPWVNSTGISWDDIEYVSNGNQNRDYAAAYGVLVKSPCTQYGTGTNYTDVTWNDDNGVLLYPDGEPRFRAVFVNGGTSTTHGTFLTQDGRDHFHDFFYNGGSYVAVCAGTFLASTSVDGTNYYSNTNSKVSNYTFGIWPGNLTHTTMPNGISKYGSIYTDLKAEMKFKDFTKGSTISLVRHHGGSFLGNTETNNSYNPERLFSYQYCTYTGADNIDSLYTDYNRCYKAIFGGSSNGKATVDPRENETAIWAYKKDNSTGRAVLCGSHPESPRTSPPYLYTSYNDQISLMKNMMEYALEGIGNANVKAELSSGGSYTPSSGIGDRQYHHYKLVAGSDIENFHLALTSEYDSSSGIDLYLALRQQKSAEGDDFAWISDADYVLCNKGGKKTISIKKLPKGVWYISVYCATTVTAELVDVSHSNGQRRFFKYSGAENNMKTLKGITYTISVGNTTKTSFTTTPEVLNNSQVFSSRI